MINVHIKLSCYTVRIYVLNFELIVCMLKCRGLTERNDELQQILERDKQIIHGLYADVTKTSEEYKQLCHELGKKWELYDMYW